MTRPRQTATVIVAAWVMWVGPDSWSPARHHVNYADCVAAAKERGQWSINLMNQAIGPQNTVTEIAFGKFEITHASEQVGTVQTLYWCLPQGIDPNG